MDVLVSQERRDRAFALSQKMLLRSVNGLKLYAENRKKTNRKFPPGGHLNPVSGDEMVSDGEFVILKK